MIRLAWLALFCAFSCFARAPRVAAQDPEQCVANSDRGQEERDAGHLLSAREAFVRCASDSCPQLVRKACAAWLTELEPRIPTLVIRVRDAKGHDLVDAQVSIDGVTLSAGELAHERAVDPGSHVVLARRGELEERRELIASERERGREVSFVLEPEPQQQTLPLTQGVVTASTRAPRRGALIAVGAGALLMASAGALTWRVHNQAAQLRDRCAPTCDDERVQGLKHQLIGADVLLGVGAATAVAGLVWWWWPARDPKEPSRAAVVPLARGAMLHVRWR